MTDSLHVSMTFKCFLHLPVNIFFQTLASSDFDVFCSLQNPKQVIGIFFALQHSLEFISISAGAGDVVIENVELKRWEYWNALFGSSDEAEIELY